MIQFHEITQLRGDGGDGKWYVQNIYLCMLRNLIKWRNLQKVFCSQLNWIGWIIGHVVCLCLCLCEQQNTSTWMENGRIFARIHNKFKDWCIWILNGCNCSTFGSCTLLNCHAIFNSVLVNHVKNIHKGSIV